MEHSTNHPLKTAAEYQAAMTGSQGVEAQRAAILASVRYLAYSALRQMSIVGNGKVKVASTGLGGFQISLL